MCGCACTHLFMWIWAEAIIKVLNSRIWGLRSKECPDKVWAPSVCWSSVLQIGANKNANTSRSGLCRYTLLYIPLLFIPSSSFNRLLHFSVFAKWMSPPIPPEASDTHAQQSLSDLTTTKALNCRQLWIFACQDKTIDIFWALTPHPLWLTW